jgi:hypothetical protein
MIKERHVNIEFTENGCLVRVFHDDEVSKQIIDPNDGIKLLEIIWEEFGAAVPWLPRKPIKTFNEEDSKPEQPDYLAHTEEARDRGES